LRISGKSRKSFGAEDSNVKQAKVKEYEHQVDQMVYELYGFTREEIKIVEGGINGEKADK